MSGLSREQKVALLGFSAIGVLIVTLVFGKPGAIVMGLAVLVAIGLLLEVALPWGGTIPLGHAVVIALPELLNVDQFVAVVAIGLAIGYPFRRHRHGYTRASLITFSLSLSSAAAIVAHRFAAEFVPRLELERTQPNNILGRVLIAGVAYLAVDVFFRSYLLRDRKEMIRIRQALPLDLTLLCAAALLAIAVRKSGVYAGLIAAVPLLVTRFSFQRYLIARNTYDQTVQALSILPEIAGRTPLGHGERTAVYAAALGRAFDMTPEKVDRLVNAAKLHSIGLISLKSDLTDLPDQVELGHVSEEILQETGFLDDVARIVNDIQSADPKDVSLEAAIIRVSSTFDELIGEKIDRATEDVIKLQTIHPSGVERKVAIELAKLCNEIPDLPQQALRAGEVLTSAAADAE